MMTRSFSEPILIVIVNYRTPDLTIDCLRSLLGECERLPAMRVVVTDNASGDDSVERINAFLDQQSSVRQWIELMPLAKNGGFAYGNNAAIRPALASSTPPDYVLLLNPDTVVRAHGVSQLVEFMNQNSAVGIAGSRLEDPDGEAQRSAFRFPTAAGALESTIRFGPLTRLLNRYCVAPPISETDCAADWVAGASMIVRRQVFDDIGLLDENYFMYYEEVDFCYRAKGAGWSCWYVPSSRVVHLVGQASGITVKTTRPKRRPAYWFESRRRYLVKNMGWLSSLCCDSANLIGLALWRLRCVIERRADYDPPHLLSDSLRQSVFCKGFSK